MFQPRNKLDTFMLTAARGYTNSPNGGHKGCMYADDTGGWYCLMPLKHFINRSIKERREGSLDPTRVVWRRSKA